MAGSSSIWAARFAPIRSIIFARSLGAVAIDPTMILRIGSAPDPLPLLLRDVAKSAEGETAETLTIAFIDRRPLKVTSLAGSIGGQVVGSRWRIRGGHTLKPSLG